MTAHDSPGHAEQALARRVAWRITLQTAALFTVCLLVLAVVTAVFTVHSQDQQAEGQLRQAIQDEDAITDPPDGVVIYESGPAGRRSSPGLDGAPLDSHDVAAVAGGGAPRTGRAHRGATTYLTRTDRRGATVVQAGYDMTDIDADRDRLAQAFAIVGGAGILLALLVGRIIALRSIRPLRLAIARQQRFVADASHELRTPLTHVHTRAQMIEAAVRETGPPQIAEDARRLVAGTRQLADIVSDLLLSAQIRIEPQRRERVDLAAIASQVVEAERARAAAKGIALLVGLDAAADAAYAVAGVPTALRRVVGSLVDNAIGHTPAGGHVTVTLTRRARHVAVAVADDGHGFDPADAERIFQRFARGTHGDGRRFGLGLSLVREAVESHGGTVTATGRPGAGATFTVTLPAWSDSRSG